MRTTEKKFHGAIVRLLCLFMLLCFLPCDIFAAPLITSRTPLINIDEPVSLTVSFRHETEAIPNASFAVYRIADVSDDAVFTPADDFKMYPVSFENLDTAGWNALSNTLAGYVLRDKPAAAAKGRTDADGILTLSELKTGLYLVTGESCIVGSNVYIPQPFLICLPNLTTEDVWEYDVPAEPKYDLRENPPQPSTVERRVLKVWDGDGDGAARPKEITVQLLRNGSVYEEVTLSRENSWRHVWEHLDASFEWSAVEKDVPKDYTVTVTREGVSFLITNTFAGAVNPPVDPDDPKLPQTGQLWWPVPVLAFMGIVLFFAGFALKKRNEDKDSGAEK